jgi:hypothetical protein
MKTKIYVTCTIFFLIFGYTVFADDEIVPDVPPVVEEQPQPPQDPTPVPQETILIRNGETVVYSGLIDLPTDGTINVPDQAGVLHAVSTRSVLGILYALDETDDNFSLSNIEFYSSFNSLYLKCITIQSDTLCDNWQYTVNNTTPSAGIDSTLLSGGESIGLYFGSPHRVSLSSSTLIANDLLTAKAESYNYQNNTWSPLLRVTIGVTVINPDDPYNPTVVTSSAVDDNGNANFILSEPGSYMIGIAEDYYFPTYSLTVTAGPVHTIGSGSTPVSVFDISKAISYLQSAQGSDGSFASSDMYTDWAAIAYQGAHVSGSQYDLLVEYLRSHSHVSTSLTDNERKAMTLLSLGFDPYNFEGTDYVAGIISRFDGTQFGELSLVNDDVFALLPLSYAGYTSRDEIIIKDISFILSRQNPNGSWENSVDMTAATIEALTGFRSVEGVSSSLDKATEYMKSMQQADGGFGSVFSTAWAAQAESSLNALWKVNGIAMSDYFATHQASDGAALPAEENLSQRIWATSYTILGSLHLPWTSIMHSVSKPAVPTVAPAIQIEKVEPLISIEEKQDIVETPEQKHIQVEPITPVIREVKVSQKKVIEKLPELVEEKQLPLTASASSSGTPIPRAIAFMSTLTIIGAVIIFRFWR